MIQNLQRRREEEGFTLIELLIVIIILGILAAIVVFALGTFRGDSVKKACKTDFKQVDTAVAAYLAANNVVPDTPSRVGLMPTTPAPGLGAYLRTYPTTTNYKIVYTNSGSGGRGGTAYTISVQDPRGNVVGSTNTNADCESLP